MKMRIQLIQEDKKERGRLGQEVIMRTTLRNRNRNGNGETHFKQFENVLSALTTLVCIECCSTWCSYIRTLLRQQNSSRLQVCDWYVLTGATLHSLIFVIVLVAFTSLASPWGECSIIHSPSAPFFLFFLCLLLFIVKISSSTLIPPLLISLELLSSN